MYLIDNTLIIQAGKLADIVNILYNTECLLPYCLLENVNRYVFQDRFQSFSFIILLFLLWMSFITSVLLWILLIFDYYLQVNILSESKKINMEYWAKDPQMLLNLSLRLVLF